MWTWKLSHNRSRDLRVLETETHFILERCTAIVCSIASVLGCCFIISTYRFRRRQRLVIDAVSRLIHVLAWFDLLGSIARIALEILKCTFKSIDKQDGDLFKTHTWADNCTANHWKEIVSQIFISVIHFNLMASIVWHCIMSYNLYRWVVKEDDQHTFNQRLRIYEILTIAFGIVLSGAPFLFDSCPAYNDVTYSIRNHLLLFTCHYVWLIIGIGGMVTCILLVLWTRHVRLKQFQGGSNRHDVAIYDKLGRALMLYVALFVVFRVATIAETSLELVLTDPVSAFERQPLRSILFFLHSIVSPLTGFANAVVFGGLMPSWCLSQRRSTANEEESVRLIVDNYDEPHCPTHGHKRLFVTSFDLSKMYFPTSQLVSWISRGYDVYVVGLQNCIDIEVAQKAILDHLNYMHHPFVQFKSLSSSSRRSIPAMDGTGLVQFVFAKTSDIAMNHIDLHEIKLHATTKNITGIAMRIFDATLSISTCSLKPISDHYTLTRKAQDAMQLLQSIESEGRLGVDLPHQHDHTILCGDFNFGISTIDSETYFEQMKAAYVAQCRVHEVDEPVVDFTTQCSYQEDSDDDNGSTISISVETFQVYDSEDSTDHFIDILDWHLPSKNEINEMDTLKWKETKEATDNATIQWNKLLEYDTLRSLMSSNDVFGGFFEPDIYFLPSYPRMYGIGSKYKSFDDLTQFYFNDIQPTYTDRIIYHSLPGVMNRFISLEYYLCEDIITSNHKPICCTFRLEVDRMHGFITDQYKNQYIFTFMNLDANIWQPNPIINQPVIPSSSAWFIAQDPIHSLIPEKIRILFPLPSNDTFRYRQKIGLQFLHPSPLKFQSIEYMTETTWMDAINMGIKHTTYANRTRILHLVIQIEGTHGEICEGVLPIREEELSHSIQFDMPLSWGGKHMGYLHGDILATIKC